MKSACLVFAVTLARISVAQPLMQDEVPFVPQYGTAPTRMFAGQIALNQSYDKQLFYWFAECEDGNLPGKTPVVLWLNGGPGASSLTGFLTENIGPLTLQLNGSLTRNRNGWTQFANVIIFENPVGVGFSQTRPGGYVTTQEQMAAELHHGVLSFLTLHPEYRNNPFWVSGESFAGHYVPYFAWEVHQQGYLNLKGIVLGNAMLRMDLQYAAIPEFAYANGLVDLQGKEEAERRYQVCLQLIKTHKNVEAYRNCQETTKWLYGEKAGGVFLYDIAAEDPRAFDSLTDVMSKYLNAPATQVALHVGPASWMQYDEDGPVSDALAADYVKPSDWVVERLLDAGYRAVMYNGVRDGSACGHLGMHHAVEKMQWHGAHSFMHAKQQPWHCNGGLLCGYNRTATSLTYLTYVRTGHLVPTTVPKAALDMWHRLLAQDDLRTTALVAGADRPVSGFLASRAKPGTNYVPWILVSAVAAGASASTIYAFRHVRHSEMQRSSYAILS